MLHAQSLVHIEENRVMLLGKVESVVGQNGADNTERLDHVCASIKEGAENVRNELKGHADSFQQLEQLIVIKNP